MSSKSRIEGVTKGVTKGVGGHDPLRRSSVKGVTGGHDCRGVTPVTPQSGGHEPFSEKFSETPLAGVTKPGTVVERAGQAYTVFSIDPYTTKDGREVELFKLLSSCRACGVTFSTTVALSTKYWNQRCPGCIRAKRTAA
jgi:hypothetical protein